MKHMSYSSITNFQESSAVMFMLEDIYLQLL